MLTATGGSYKGSSLTGTDELLAPEENAEARAAGAADLAVLKEQVKAVKDRIDKGEKWSKQGIMGKQTQDAKIDLLSQKFNDLVARMSAGEKQGAAVSALGRQMEIMQQVLKRLEVKADSSKS